MVRTKVKISLLEVILGLLQPIHPVLYFQVELRLMKVVTKDFPFPKTWGLTLKTNLYIKTNLYNVQNQSYNFNP